MHEYMPMSYMPTSDSIQLRFTLKKRCSPSQARLIGPFFKLASVMMKASSGCSLRGDIGHLDSIQPSWQHPWTLYRSPQICLVSNPPLLYSVKLEKPDNLVNLSSVSSEGAIPNIYPQLSLHTPLLAISSAVSTQSLSSLLLVHLVIPTSQHHHTTPILVSIPVSYSALDT
jgi:hypothetical protein